MNLFTEKKNTTERRIEINQDMSCYPRDGGVATCCFLTEATQK